MALHRDGWGVVSLLRTESAVRHQVAAFPVPAEIIRLPVADDPLYLARPGHPASWDLADARHDAWMMEPEGSVGRRWAIARCRDAGFQEYRQLLATLAA